MLLLFFFFFGFFAHSQLAFRLQFFFLRVNIIKCRSNPNCAVCAATKQSPKSSLPACEFFARFLLVLFFSLLLLCSETLMCRKCIDEQQAKLKVGAPKPSAAAPSPKAPVATSKPAVAAPKPAAATASTASTSTSTSASASASASPSPSPSAAAGSAGSASLQRKQSDRVAVTTSESQSARVGGSSTASTAAAAPAGEVDYKTKCQNYKTQIKTLIAAINEEKERVSQVRDIVTTLHFD